MKLTNLKLNNEERRLYVTSVDLAQHLGIPLDSREYENMRNRLIDYSHKSSIFSTYQLGETNPNKYTLRVNLDWYLYSDIKEIMTELIKNN